ncbi:MAG: hypothetical protein EXS05_06465 [Planctomycetaceae bacterium]|nr:hypothetical protein [Planctomycetaceae bacterium]
MRSLLCLLAAAACLATGLVQPVRAEPPAAAGDLAVDIVTFQHGLRLLGSVVDRSADGAVTMAIRREWLQGAHPKFYESRLADELVERQSAYEQLHDRIDQWRKQRADDERLEFFLKKEAERVAKSIAALTNKSADEPSEFVLLTFPKAEVERVVVQPPQRKQVAGVAWSEQLADVEKRSVGSLTRELEKLKIDAAKVRVDLSDRLPVRRQTEAEWGARQALVEYQYRKPLNFQGTGDLVVRTGEGEKAPGIGDLLAKILQSQVADQLADLLGEPGKAKSKPESTEWLRSATKTAEAEAVAGFRVTRVNPDAGLRQVSVETRFVAKVPGGTWETIWRHTETVDASKANKDLVDRIANDPQIKQILELTKAAGLGAGDDTLQTALKFGAATMQAQETANARFMEFRDRYLQRLEGPPLMIGPTARKNGS